MAHLAVPSAASFAKSCDISTEARGRSRIRVDRRAALPRTGTIVNLLDLTAIAFPVGFRKNALPLGFR
jgi:Asp-tRNA(Asn)/Glu-tRNA(Gln) amidotransferase A subunit family amidase